MFISCLLRATLLAVFTACWAVMIGCNGSGAAPASGAPAASPQAERPTRVAPITNVDPCATRLHDLAGSILLYYFYHGYLPDELHEVADHQLADELPPMHCPVSELPYIYNPDGILLAEQRALVVLYDAAPSHSNMRWALTVAEPEQEGGPLVMKVVALPESFFLLR